MRAVAATAGVILALSLASTPAPALGVTPVGVVAASGATDEVPFYVVQTAFNGEPEFLFEIAQRFLGDGERFREIFALNEGRVQPDGLAMTDPAVVKPGWILQLPTDARGEELEFAPSISEFQPARPVAGASPSASAPAGDGTVDESTPDDGQPEATGVPAFAVIAGAGAIAAIVLAGLSIIVIRRMRRRGASATRATRLPADRSSSWIVDSALKILLAACARENVRFPGLYLVTVDDDAVHLLLTAPATPAPIGWTASADGRTWTATHAHLQAQPVPAGADRSFSRLVGLGMSASGAILLDFSRANGPISIDGPAEAVDEVVEAWIAELTTSPWSDPDQRVVRAGGREESGQRSLDAVLERLEQEGTGIIVLESPPSRAQGEVLRTLFGSSDFSWVVLVKGGFGAAPWRFTARGGVLTSGFLPDVRYTAPRATPEPAHS